MALGYPLSGLLATTPNVSVGNVSALAGIGDNSRYLQISAPVQSGNSGGPLLDASGHLIGIVTGKLDATRIFQVLGDIPQNVNFAIKAEVVRTFLDSKGITYQTARSEGQLSPADVGEMARPLTVQIECEQRTDADQSRPMTTSPPKDVEQPRSDQPARSLVATSPGRWAIGDQSNCNIASKAYHLRLDGGTVVWENGNGNIDVERITFSDETEFRTVTIESIHHSDSGFSPGTQWNYLRNGPEGIRVVESGGKSYLIARCR